MHHYKQILYQLVFTTKYRKHTVPDVVHRELYNYIWGILKNNRCYLYRIGGITNHLHIIFELHPAVALSDLVKDIKVASNEMLKKTGKCPDFIGWQTGYSAFTYAADAKHNLINYVKNQKQHHNIKTFENEYIELLQEHEIEFDIEHLFDDDNE